MSPDPSPRLVLASTSRYRRQLLERFGIPFDVIAPDCDESAVHLPDPVELTTVLARTKAESVDAPGALIIGSDQVVEHDGAILGKPGSTQNAVAQLERLSGQTHRLVTAVAVRGPDRTEVALDIHTLTMRTLDRATIEHYVRHDRPERCAGSYRLESRGIALFEHIEADPDTADDTAIIGLPLMKLCELLRRFGMDVLTQ